MDDEKLFEEALSQNALNSFNDCSKKDHYIKTTKKDFDSYVGKYNVESHKAMLQTFVNSPENFILNHEIQLKVRLQNEKLCQRLMNSNELCEHIHEKWNPKADVGDIFPLMCNLDIDNLSDK